MTNSHSEYVETAYMKANIALDKQNDDPSADVTSELLEIRNALLEAKYAEE